jgi:hypothetical protein
VRIAEGNTTPKLITWALLVFVSLSFSLGELLEFLEIA